MPKWRLASCKFCQSEKSQISYKIEKQLASYQGLYISFNSLTYLVEQAIVLVANSPQSNMVLLMFGGSYICLLKSHQPSSL